MYRVDNVAVCVYIYIYIYHSMLSVRIPEAKVFSTQGMYCGIVSYIQSDTPQFEDTHAHMWYTICTLESYLQA
jgi:hypothetical protein